MSAPMAPAPAIKQQWFNNGVPLSGGQLFSYQAGTSTPQNTYTDQGGLTPNTNPVVLDANGEANVWLDPNLSYKFVLEDALNNVLWTVDNVVGALTPNAVTTNSIQNAAVTLAKLSATLGANQVLGANAAGTALEAKSITAGANIAVTQSVGGIQVSSPGSSNLAETFNLSVPAIVAGETIVANNAVCLDLARDSGNNDIYMIFKCNSSLPNRKNGFVGFANAGASVTQGTWTWVASGAGSGNFVASNVIKFSINGRAYTVNFTTDNATTLQAVATAIAGDPDVAGAVSDGSHTVTVTGLGAKYVNITGSTVTGGATQPTITYTNTLAPTGGSLTITAFGPMAGFSGLTTTNQYYVDSVSGGITAAPTDLNPMLVGQALSSSVIFVNRNTPTYQFTTPAIVVASHGSTKVRGVGTDTSTVDHYNFVSWSAGTNDSLSNNLRDSLGIGESYIGSFMYVVDGITGGAGTNASLFAGKYNKSSWAVDTQRAAARAGFATGQYNSTLVCASGIDSSAVLVNTLDSYNGTAWTTGVAGSNNAYKAAGFVQNALFHVAGGYTAGVITTHNSYNGSAMSGATVLPSADCFTAGMRTVSGNAIVAAGGQNTNSYTWNGSAWSASLTVPYQASQSIPQNLQTGPRVSAFNSGNNLAMMNGGDGGSADLSTAVGTTAHFNGTAWAAGTTSSNVRCSGVGACF